MSKATSKKKINAIQTPMEVLTDLSLSKIQTLSAVDLSVAKYPVYVYLNDPMFQLRSIDGLKIIRPNSLKELDLSGNQLVKLDDIAQFTDLKRLQASNNLLESFNFAASLSKLNELNLANNQLTTFPDLTRMPNLMSLNVSNNAINGKLSILKSCPNLQVLNCSNNKFKWTQDELFENIVNFMYIKKLMDVDFSNNPGINEIYGYRHWMLYALPAAQRFDGGPCSPNEKPHHPEKWRPLVEQLALELYAGSPLYREKLKLQSEIKELRQEIREEEELREDVEDLIDQQEDEIVVLSKHVDMLQRSPNNYDAIIQNLHKEMDQLAAEWDEELRAKNAHVRAADNRPKKERKKSITIGGQEKGRRVLFGDDEAYSDEYYSDEY